MDQSLCRYLKCLRGIYTTASAQIFLQLVPRLEGSLAQFEVDGIRIHLKSFLMEC
jgi:hypothetical protein